MPRDDFVLPPPERSNETSAVPAGSPNPAPTLPDPPDPRPGTTFVVPVAVARPSLVPTPMTAVPQNWTLGEENGAGDGGIGAIGVQYLDNPPRARVQVAPVYPMEAKRDGRTGEVTVEFMVDEHGTVENPRVQKSDDHIFDEAALRAVARWRFEPGLVHGRAVRFRMAVPIVFKLDQ
ncbi:MAG TPA: TonB family protein [Opitutaceae bacterium]|nr:TonB family protein [Opitutaceae bacterium]